MTTFPNNGVQFVRAEVREFWSQYQVISDCLDGEKKVKSRGEEYLPNPSSLSDEPTERAARYTAYLLRALFYNFTRRTLQGLCGQAFSKPPSQNEFPVKLKPVIDSISGDGVTLDQQAKEAFECTLAYNRAGLLVDFPNTGGAQTSRKELDEGLVRPTVTLYKATEIVNWRVQDLAAEEILTLLVLSEIHQVQDEDDPFVLVDQQWFRVLKLTDAGVTVEIWKPVQQSKQTRATHYEATPAVPIKGGNGQPLDRIPFKPIGVGANSMRLEAPGFYDLASLNIAHYRNSADYEEMLFVTGQATPVVTGLTKEWLENTLKGRINFGSRGGLPLPVGAEADLLQVQAQSVLIEALQHKESQAVALGAKLVEQKQVQRTATESKIESTAEGSVLESVAVNVSAAYTAALKICCEMLQIPFTDEFSYEVNTDFDITKLSIADLGMVDKSTMLSWGEKRRAYRAVGLAVEDDEDVKAELEQAKQDEMDREIALANSGPPDAAF